MGSSTMGPQQVNWVRHAQAGDRESLGMLMQQFRPWLLAFFRSRIGNSQAIRDLAQNVLLRVSQKLHQLSDPGKFRSWLWTIAERAVAEFLGERSFETNDDEAVPDKVIFGDPSVDVDNRDYLINMAAYLTPEDRELAWKRAAGLDTTWIALSMGKTPEAIRQQVHRLHESSASAELKSRVRTFYFSGEAPCMRKFDSLFGFAESEEDAFLKQDVFSLFVANQIVANLVPVRPRQAVSRLNPANEVLLGAYRKYIAQSMVMAQESADPILLAAATWDKGLACYFGAVSGGTIDQLRTEFLKLFRRSCRVHGTHGLNAELAPTIVADAAIASRCLDDSTSGELLRLGEAFFRGARDWTNRSLIQSAMNCDDLIGFWLSRWSEIDLARSSVYRVSVLSAIQWILRRVEQRSEDVIA